MSKLATLEFHGGNLRFSSGHFTIFSETHREHMHGHNYRLEAAMTAPIGEPGITFDYAIFREKLAVCCQQLHSHFLLPTQSPYLEIKKTDEYIYAYFNGQALRFIPSDIVLLEISNITIEELSHWFIDQLLKDQRFIQQYAIHSMMVRVFNTPQHSATARWDAQR